ncbi:MAG TPA: PAS domain S-box protein [Candidatus Dormibacteraeota bacterium]|nr:PAS domain S-box protein [Candidatus Dormibacteraeota bacterium]
MGNGNRQTLDRDTRAPRAPTKAAEAVSRLAAIHDLSDDAIVAIDLDGVITGWSRGAERIYGYPAEVILGNPISVLVPMDRRDEWPQIIINIKRGDRVHHLETVRLRSDGAPIDVSLSVAPTRDDTGRVTGGVAIARDITAVQQALHRAERSSEKLSEREKALRQALSALRKSHEEVKTAQLQLVQAAKLESIGRLAAGVAHEVKNPLAIILSAVEFLSQAIPNPDPDVTMAMADVQEAVRRADHVIRGLLDFSHATEFSLEDGNLNEILEKSVNLVRHWLSKAHVTLVKELGADLPNIMLDASKIEQVFVNLMINSIDAMPSGGTLTVRTSRRRMTVGPDVGIRRTDQFRIGQSVLVVEIEDTGTGVDEATRIRLFDPFFTTKPTGKGTGLGLAMSKTIIALHGGTIQIANRENGGARATVVFHIQSS